MSDLFSPILPFFSVRSTTGDTLYLSNQNVIAPRWRKRGHDVGEVTEQLCLYNQLCCFHILVFEKETEGIDCVRS